MTPSRQAVPTRHSFLLLSQRGSDGSPARGRAPRFTLCLSRPATCLLLPQGSFFRPQHWRSTCQGEEVHPLRWPWLSPPSWGPVNSPGSYGLVKATGSGVAKTELTRLSQIVNGFRNLGSSQCRIVSCDTGKRSARNQEAGGSIPPPPLPALKAAPARPAPSPCREDRPQGFLQHLILKCMEININSKLKLPFFDV